VKASVKPGRANQGLAPPRARSSIVVASGEGGRLDSYLVRVLPGLTRRAIQRHFARGRIEVNGRTAHKGQRIEAGDRIDFSSEILIRPDDLRAEPRLPVRVLFEDADCVAVDKPPGMPVVALDGGDSGTLANSLVGRFPETRAAGRSPLEAGSVHRLDNATSGVVLVARHRRAYEQLRRQFAERRVTREYWAIVEGDCAAAGRIERPIAHAPGRAERMCVCSTPARARQLRARPAFTAYRPRERLRSATLVEISISTGVRHQIRVHLASIGHPIAGDVLYGAAAVSAGRPLLHARRLGFVPPSRARPLSVTAPLPRDFRSALSRLRRGVGGRRSGMSFAAG
jgi:23S rRNA pseudouridine1911/1915/1917 synthase